MIEEHEIFNKSNGLEIEIASEIHSKHQVNSEIQKDVALMEEANGKAEIEIE